MGRLDRSKIDLEAELEELEKMNTEHELVENELKSALRKYDKIERRLTTLMNNLKGMVFKIKIDEKWTIEFVSDGCREITGYKPSELIGTQFYLSSLLHPCDRQKLKTKQQVSLDTGSPLKAEYRILTKIGKIKWVWEQSLPIVNDQGEVTAVEGFITDITENVIARDALKKSEQELKNLSCKLLISQENEVKRISNKLHDDIGQTLFAINFGVKTAMAQLETGQKADAMKTLKESLPTIQDLGYEIDRFCNELRPCVLDNLGIVAAITWFNRRFQKLFPNIKIDKQINLIEDDIPKSLKIVIYRIMQESITNVVKHSGADHIVVCLLRENGNIELSVKDNGNGFNPKFELETNMTARGIGVSSMKKRVALSGGKFHIASAHDTGTVVEALWKIQP
ncbi:MAG: PAS domain-containing protein [Deltaproteobacteria bacterium]|nr:PAS domain-containing protein [Deltaproteobacteria bacterium]